MTAIKINMAHNCNKMNQKFTSAAAYKMRS